MERDNICEQKAIIKFLTIEGVSSRQIHERLVRVFKTNALCYARVKYYRMDYFKKLLPSKQTSVQTPSTSSPSQSQTAKTPSAPSRSNESAENADNSSPTDIATGNKNDSAEHRKTSSSRNNNAKYYLNRYRADIFFIVKNECEPIPAHSWILSEAWNYFRTSNLKYENGKTEIKVLDVAPSAFKNLLRYLYTNEILVAVDEALETAYVAKKYQVIPLYRASLTLVKAHLNADNVCSALTFSRAENEKSLENGCWLIVDALTEDVLNSKEFLAIDRYLLKEIVSRETLMAREMSIYNAVVRWAKAECERCNLMYDSKELHNIVGDVIDKIRFYLMSKQDSKCDITKSHNLFQQTQFLLCLQLILSKSGSSLNIIFKYAENLVPEKTSERAARHPMRILRSLPHVRCTNAFNRYDVCSGYLFDSVRFRVDRRIILVGVRVRSCCLGLSNPVKRVKAVATKNGTVMRYVEAYSYSGPSLEHPTITVIFDHFLQVEAREAYELAVEISNTKEKNIRVQDLQNADLQLQEAWYSTNTNPLCKRVNISIQNRYSRPSLIICDILVIA
uniref:BTB domain-containing protein n=1 Tax=Syphacia muris TaxID=451379 RepID=A0A0N5AUZ5_9BILA